MNLEQIFPNLQTLLATDEKLAAVPFLGQIASAVEDSAAVRDFNQKLEAALSGEGEGNVGLAFVAVVAEGDLAGDSRIPALALENTVMLSIVENPKKNATGLTAFQYVRRVMRVLHRGSITSQGARTDFALSKPAYNVGPLNRGTNVYFVNLIVRTIEDLGAINPA